MGLIVVSNLAMDRRRRRGDVNVGRGTVLGSPFVARGEGERDDAVACYWKLLRGEDAHTLAREAGVSVHEGSARVSHARRMHALSLLTERVRGGENVRLLCAEAPHVNHGHVVKVWVERALAGKV